MPLLCTTGAAALSAFGFVGGGPLRYATGLFPTTAGTSSALNTLGVQDTDFAVWGSASVASAPTTAGGSWTSMGSDGAINYYYRKLNGTDVASGMTYSGSGAVMFWRGTATTAARRGTANYAGSNPVAISGFTPSGSFLGLAAFGVSTSGIVGAPAITPTTFTLRGTSIEPINGTYTWAYDRLTPPNAVYAGAAFSVTFDSADGVVSIIEIMS